MFFKKRLKDPQLLEALKSDDSDAMAQLYTDNYTSVRNFVMRNSGRPEDAEDILQDAIIIVWNYVKKPDFTLQARLTTLVMGIAQKLWLKKIRKDKKIQFIPDPYVQARIDHYDPEPMREKEELARKALNMLDPNCKQLLTLFYFYDKSTQDIATEMNLANANVVKSRKYQCLKKLQSVFGAQYNQSDVF